MIKIWTRKGFVRAIFLNDKYYGSYGSNIRGNPNTGNVMDPLVSLNITEINVLTIIGSEDLEISQIKFYELKVVNY